MNSSNFDAALAFCLQNDGISDIHLGAGTLPRVRLHGDVYKLAELKDAPVGAGETTTNEDMQRLCAPRYVDGLEAALNACGQDDNFGLTLQTASGPSRLRAHAYMAKGQARLALRKLRDTIPLLQVLGLPQQIEELFQANGGLLWVVGPTGCGKSTTLAAGVAHINGTVHGHIVTLEDPIEYLHESQSCFVSQREIGADCPGFGAGVRAAMREDPDVIMVGEVKDLETMRACLSAAQTGHFVLATLHTNNAAETIERVLSFFPETERELARSVLSATLRGVIAQRLVMGRDSRVLIAEVLRANTSVRASIRSGQTEQIKGAMATGLADGQVTFNRALLEAVRLGRITREVAMANSPDTTELQSLMR